MWEGVRGKRLKDGVRATIVSVPVTAVLFFLSFYMAIFYLTIPVVLIIIFHFAKSWRFTDRAFYGIISVVLAFVIAGAGISSTVVQTPNHDSLSYVTAQGTYNIYFNYTNVQGNYTAFFELQSANLSSNLNIMVKDLFSNATLASYNATMTKVGTNYSLSENLGKLTPSGYILYYTFYTMSNNATIPHRQAFIGPILVPLTTVLYYFLIATMGYYVTVTYVFFIIFVYVARVLTTMSKRSKGKGGKPRETEIQQPPDFDKDPNEGVDVSKTQNPMDDPSTYVGADGVGSWWKK